MWEGRRGVSPEYRRLKLVVLVRDGYICQLCGGGGATSVDHRLARAHGGTDALDNLQAAHPACNAHKAAAVDSKRRHWGRLRAVESHPGTLP